MPMLHVHAAFPLLVMRYSAACPRCFSAGCPLDVRCMSAACPLHVRSISAEFPLHFHCMSMLPVSFICKNNFKKCVETKSESRYDISVCKIRKKGNFVASFSHEPCKNFVKTLVLKASFAFCVNIKK
jgi:hypothetical protein